MHLGQNLGIIKKKEQSETLHGKQRIQQYYNFEY